MIKPTWYPDKKQLRQFAVFSLPGFALIGVIARWKFDAPAMAYALWVLGVLIFLVGLASPLAVRPVYTLLMAIALPIGWLVSNLLLRVLFYGIFIPVGLILRLFGRDPLRLKRPDSTSYWLDRQPPEDVASYYRQS